MAWRPGPKARRGKRRRDGGGGRTMPDSRHPSVPSPGARRVAVLVALLGADRRRFVPGRRRQPRAPLPEPPALVALTPRPAYVVAAAWDVPFPLLLLVAVARLGLADPVHFLLGREAGPAVLARAQRTRLLGRVARRLPSTPGHLWLSAVAISPTAKTIVVAGARPAGRAGRGRQRHRDGRSGVDRVDSRALFPSASETLAVLSAWVAAPCAVGVASLIVLRHRQRLRIALARRLGVVVLASQRSPRRRVQCQCEVLRAMKLAKPMKPKNSSASARAGPRP